MPEPNIPKKYTSFSSILPVKKGCLSFNLVAGQRALVRPDVVAKLRKDNPIHEWFIPSLENGIPVHAPANSRGREYTDACAQ